MKYLDAWSYCEWFNLLGFPLQQLFRWAIQKKDCPSECRSSVGPWEEEVVLAVAAKLRKKSVAERKRIRPATRVTLNRPDSPRRS